MVTSDVAAAVERLQSWIGRREIAHDLLDLGTVRRVSALLDLDPSSIAIGDPLPEFWHSVFFSPIARQSLLDADGHPRRGDFLPPVPLPRRLFGGRRLAFASPLEVGAPVERSSTIRSIVHRRGASGDLVVVGIEREIRSEGRLTVIEGNDVVYRPEPSTRSPGAGASDRADGAARGALANPDADMEETWRPDAVQLFRYSATCFNAHRIHYDVDYARRVEGYGDLVVNGGLTALRLAELAKRIGTPGRLSALTLRHVRPLFAGRTATLQARPTASGLGLRAFDDAGLLAADGFAERCGA